MGIIDLGPAMWGCVGLALIALVAAIWNDIRQNRLLRWSDSVIDWMKSVTQAYATQRGVLRGTIAQCEQMDKKIDSHIISQHRVNAQVNSLIADAFVRQEEIEVRLGALELTRIFRGRIKDGTFKPVERKRRTRRGSR